MEAFPATDLANVAIDGMRQKSVDIMSAGKPWGQDELFLSFYDLLQAEYCNGIYNVRILQADPDQPPNVQKLLIKVYNYGGSNTSPNERMVVTRCLQHFLPGTWKKLPGNRMYQLMQEPDTRAEAKAVSIISPALVAAYGPTPMKLIETCFLDLMGCWQHGHSAGYDTEKKLWMRLSGETLNLLPEAWLTQFKAYADPSATASRDIIKSALQSHGLNVSSPMFEAHGTVGNLCLALMTGGVIFLREHHSDCFNNSLSKAYKLTIPSAQKREILAMGYKVSTRMKYDGTPATIQLHVTDEDDDRNWANLKVSKPEYEAARRILLSLTWVSTITGEEVKYYLKNTSGANGGGKPTTDLVRAREAMSLLEYANGTLKLGEESPPNRRDFGSKERNKAKVLDERLTLGVACPGPNCDFKHRSEKSKDLHFKANPSCKAAYVAMTRKRKQEFQFIICWKCGFTCANVTVLAAHLFGSDKITRPAHPACARHFRATFGSDAKPTSENSNRFM
jgi:hypothetical protein